MDYAQLRDGRCVFNFWMFMDLDAVGDTFTFKAAQRKPMTCTRVQLVAETLADIVVDLELE
ncbi:hypothetical protein [Nocardioides sp. CF8]|uniref:hypothetical protein n=1 Tax=Nocardioides sp. CF8 TaxID=110319 RepID=UPI0012EBDD76|nr:hypothetical protein [Nocardioides sp. CF8]